MKLTKQLLSRKKSCPAFLSLSIKILVFCILYCTNDAVAESDAFSNLTLSFSIHANTNHGQFHEYWQRGRGLDLNCATPFYLGRARLGVQASLFEKKSDVPEFYSLYYYLEWGFDIPLTNRIDWFNGLRSGSFAMTFDDDEINETQVTESELCLGISSSINAKITNQLAVNLTGSYQKVFTRKRLELTFILIGMNYTFDTPSWLREILK